MNLEIGEWHLIELPLHRYNPNFDYAINVRDIPIQFDAMIVGFAGDKVDVSTGRLVWRIKRSEIISEVEQ